MAAITEKRMLCVRLARCSCESVFLGEFPLVCFLLAIIPLFYQVYQILDLPGQFGVDPRQGG